MNADIKGALEQLNRSWRAFVHKGQPMSKKEVEACLKYGLYMGYTSTSQLTEKEVEIILKQLKP